MTTPCNIEAIIFQNNLTVAFLQDEDFSNAIESSALALQHHKELQTSNSAQGIRNMPRLAGHDDVSPDSLDQCMLLAGSRVGLIDEANEVEDDNDDKNNLKTHPFVYDCGIQLPAKATTSDVSAVLIFNSALSYHLYAQQQLLLQNNHHQAMKKKETNKDSLHHLLINRAKRLYEFAFAVHSDNDVRQNNILFQFAVINNIAVINRLVGNEQESQTYFENLFSVLMVMVDQDNLPRLRQLQGFLRNLPSGRNPNIATAA